MKKILYIVLVLATFITVYIVVKDDSSRTNKSDTLQAINGIMDLRNINFQTEAVKLDGEWEFIPNQLVTSEGFKTQPSSIIHVPDLWKNYKIDGQPVSKYTSGTYRLKILVDNKTKLFGLKTTNIRMSNAVYINGEFIGGSGKPEEDDSYIPHNNPVVAYFSPNSEEIELIIHVANFDYASGGGIIGSIYFGDQASIMKIQKASLIYDWVTVAAFLTMFVYFLGTYLNFKKDIDMLYFSLYCLSIVIYSATHGEKVLMSLYPALNYELFERIQMISSICIGLFLLLYFSHALKQYTNKKVVSFLRITGIGLLLTGLFPVLINSQLQFGYSAYLFVIIVYTIFTQIRAIRHREVGTIYLILSSIAIFVYYVVGTLNVLSNYQLTILPPILPFICLSMMSLFISKRFTDSYLKKEELSNALLRVDKLKDEFIAKTSHEFQTPLHGITAISQSLLDKGEQGFSTEEKEKVNLILAITNRLSHLVNDILDHSKIMQGELNLTIAPVDLYALTHVITDIFNFIIEKKDVTIHNRVQRGQYVLADEGRLRQILYNLIDNAVKYTNEGSINITSRLEHGQVIIEVSDTGIGIQPEYLDVLFEPFQQFENSIGGTGLGLSVVKQLVELQGGEIHVTSEVGKGTLFSFTLKAVEPTGISSPVNSSKQYFKSPVQLAIPLFIEKAGCKKILIADDDHINLKVLIDTLETEPYSIIAVDNGQAVLDQIALHSDIDLIVLDIMMPKLSGYEVSQQLRKMFSLSELPILMLTAAIRPEDMVAAFQSGANDFLHKPFNASELKTRIRNLLLMKESAVNMTKMEIAFLQAQIKPHFIYNVLNTILSLSYMDIEKSRTLITDFAKFLRGSFSFENTNSLAPIQKELSLVQSYVNIHRTRFPQQLEFELNLEENLNCLIPPLLIQPVIENAILHGLKNKKVDGKISLLIYKNRTMLTIKVRDNGGGISPEQLKHIFTDEKPIEQGIGLQNIAKRLHYYQNASIHISSVENDGTTVEIHFPLIFERKEVTTIA